MRALVTGAETPEGLAVVRALGRAGVEVIAAGDRSWSIGFASRYPLSRHRYTSAARSPRRLVDDLVDIVARTDPDVLIPVGEDLLVILAESRHRITRHTVLAAPPDDVLGRALDRAKTLALVTRLGIVAPRWAQGETLTELLEAAEPLRFPVAIRPRGPALYRPTAHTLDFAVRYAEDREGLARLLAPRQRDVRMTVVEECLTGVGQCVSAVCDQGKILSLFACEWEREYPLTGGVSVVRRSIALDPRLASAAARLLEAWAWHGAAMIEFRYDRRDDEYTFAGVSPRFPTATGLALEAGRNLPHLVAALYAGAPGAPLPDVRPYQVGRRERWLRGDILALRDALAKPAPRAPALVPYARTSPVTLWGTFLGDFLRWARTSEFHPRDPGPALFEAGALLGILAGWLGAGTLGALRAAGRGIRRLSSWALTSRTPPLEREPPFAFEPREEGVVPARFEIGEEAGIVRFDQDPGPGSGEFALSEREG